VAEVSAVPLTVTGFLICDDVRIEQNNKLMLIGVYAESLNFGSSPGTAFVHPVLTIISRHPGRFPLHLRFSWEGIMETNAYSAPPELVMDIELPGHGLSLQLPLPPLVIQASRSTTLLLEHDGGPDGWYEVGRIGLNVPPAEAAPTIN
jgi:hypothetical protein